MDDFILAKIREKIAESDMYSADLSRLADLLSQSHDRDSVMVGIVAGRLYNSFCYQTRRLLQRDPTEQEFEEFLDVVMQANIPHHHHNNNNNKTDTD